MQATIEIDDNLLPDGYEAVAFRLPIDGEMYLNGSAVTKYNAKYVSEPTLIVRLKWQWPTWMTCRSIAKRGDGVWVYFRSSIPVDEIRDGRLWRVDSDGVCGIPLPSAAIDLSGLPECDPADSLRINPNWKE